jgi:glycopeptide antibiotics resistance protein
MLEYIIKDLITVLRYFPYGLVVGIFAAVMLGTWNDRIKRHGKRGFCLASRVCFFMYLAIILCITFLSRESGYGREPDFRLFSTLGINARNNAYVVENILLFIPYGFIFPWSFEKMRKPHISVAAGFITSFLIEALQLITGRGFFQIDDIITNTIGMLGGYIMFAVFRACAGFVKSRQCRKTALLCTEVGTHGSQGVFFQP